MTHFGSTLFLVSFIAVPASSTVYAYREIKMCVNPYFLLALPKHETIPESTFRWLGLSINMAEDDAREQKKEQTKPHSDITEAVGKNVNAQRSP